MNVPRQIPRVFAFAAIILLASSAVLPAVAAQSQLNVRSVGEIFVDASGRATGDNLAAGIAEAQGIISGFVSLALDTEIFSSVSIDGFAQAEKIQGVGSSSILLRGSNAVVAIHDNIMSVVKVQTTSATSVHWKLSNDVRAEAEGRGVMHLYTSSGAYLGSIVAVGADAPQASGAALARASGEVVAHAKAGSQIAFLAKPVYLSSDAYHQAVVEAAAEGRLTATYVTEFEGSAVAQSQVDYAAQVIARSSASAHGAVETSVKSRAEASAMVAYDLAYETLPARSADEVAVFADGKLAARAETAAEVRAYAEQGIAAYHAVVANGRTMVLASTPDFESTAEHRLSISASAHSRTEAEARAEERAESSSRAYGNFEHHANGKITGDFLTSILAQGSLELFSYTELESRTEIFKQVSVDGAASGTFRSVSDHSFRAEGPNADLTIVDDAYATMLVDAKAQTDAAFELAANVKAEAVSANMVRLEGPNGYAGALILADAQANAASRLTLQGESTVKAALEGGARLVYRGNAEAYASERVVAEAIAKGTVGAQVLAGIQGSAVAAADTEYAASVATEVVAHARGSFQVDYTTQAEAASSFVFDARGTALAAKTANDVRVLVNGQAAVLASSPEAALSVSGYAKYYAETTLDGSVRVLVNTAAEAHASARVNIESRLDAAAKAAANADAFGTFKLFYDGTAIGDFVTMRSNQQAGVVSDFSLAASGQVFASVVAGASSFVSAGADGATTLVLENKQTKLEITDTTSAFMKIVAKAETDVAFRLAADLHAEAKSQNVIELVNANGAHVGSMIITSVEGKAALASSFETNAQGQVQAHLEQGAQVLFKAHAGIETELSAAQRTMISQAIAQGHVAGQVFVQTTASMSAKAHAAAQAAASLEATARTGAEVGAESVAIGAAELQGQVTAAVTANYYGDVQMLTAATKERVDVTISSTSKVGKTVIVSLDPATIEGMAEGNAVILFDGHAAAQADSYADILNPNDDDGVAEYFVLAGEAGTQVLVSIPHFSVHTVTLKERETSSTSLYMIASIVLGLLVVVETVVLVRRRIA